MKCSFHFIWARWHVHFVSYRTFQMRLSKCTLIAMNQRHLWMNVASQQDNRSTVANGSTTSKAKNGFLTRCTMTTIERMNERPEFLFLTATISNDPKMSNARRKSFRWHWIDKTCVIKINNRWINFVFVCLSVRWHTEHTTLSARLFLVIAIRRTIKDSRSPGTRHWNFSFLLFFFVCHTFLLLKMAKKGNIKHTLTRVCPIFSPRALLCPLKSHFCLFYVLIFILFLFFCRAFTSSLNCCFHSLCVNWQR